MTLSEATGGVRRPRSGQNGRVTDRLANTRRDARSVQTTIGWVFWDPGAVHRYRAEGPPGYEDGWLPASRGTAPEDVAAGWAALSAKGLAEERTVTPEGLAGRQWTEDEADRRTTVPWVPVGEARARAFAERLEPPCTRLLARIDETAGPNCRPASLVRAW